MKLFTRRKPIYLVTTVAKFEVDKFYPNGNVYQPIGMRTPVYRHSFKEAENVVKTNMCDIWEFYYDYALIEEIPPCIYPSPIKRWWYQWDDNEKIYKEIELPYNLGDDGYPCSYIIG